MKTELKLSIQHIQNTMHAIQFCMIEDGTSTNTTSPS